MDYPSNSQKSKEQKEDPPQEDKKVQKVVANQVVRRKKPLGKRFAELFVGGDARSVFGYILVDVLVPAAKDTIADVFSQGIERMLYGESRSTSRRTGLPGGYNGRVAYNRIGQNSRLGREEARNISRRSRASHNFDEIILATRVEAEAVIDQLFEIISKYESATVADLYDLVGITGEYTDDKWGWTDIRGAGATRVRSGYLLDLPKPEPLS